MSTLVAKPHYKLRSDGTAIIEYRVPSLKAGRVLSNVDDSRGWVTIQDFVPGAFQQDVEVNPDRAQTNWAVFACQTLIAGDVGKLGVKLQKWNEKAQIYNDVDSPSVTPFLTKPNNYQTWQKFVESWILSKVSTGNAYILKERDARGVVIAGHVLAPSLVTPLVALNGDVFYRLQEDDLAQIPEGSPVVPASEIIHDRYWCLFHPLVGIAPIYANGLAATQGLAIQNQSSKFFNNSAMPGGVLVAPQRIDDELAAKYKARFEANYSGANRGRIAVLGGGLKYEQITQNAVDSELVAQLKLTSEMVCSTYHVPGYKIGVGPMPNFQSAVMLNQDYYDNCLQALLQSVELCLDEGLDLRQKGFKTQLDEDDLLRMDKSAMMDFVAKGIEKAIFSPNEGRRRFNMPPVSGGEVPLLQQQMFSLPALAKRDASEDPFANNTPKPPAIEPPAEPVKDMTLETVAMMLKRAGPPRRRPELRVVNG